MHGANQNWLGLETPGGHIITELIDSWIVAISLVVPNWATQQQDKTLDGSRTEHPFKEWAW